MRSTVIAVGATARTTETNSRISSLAAIMCSGSGAVMLRGIRTSGLEASCRVRDGLWMISDILRYQNLFAWVISSVLMKIGYRVSGFGFREMPQLLLVAAFCFLYAAAVRAQPDKGYHAISYSAIVTLDRAHDSLSGVVTMNGFAASPITEVVQHAKFILIDSVFLNGKRATFLVADTGSGEYDVIPIDDPSFTSNFTVTTYYHGPGKQEQYPPPYKWGGVDDEDSMMFAMGVGLRAP